MTNPFWNRDERRVRAFWRIVAQIALHATLIGVLGQLLRWVTVALGVVEDSDVGLFAFLRTFRPEDPRSGTVVQGTLMIASVVSAAIATCFLDRRPFARIGFSVRRALWWKDLAFGMTAGVFYVAVVLACDLALGRVEVVGWFVPIPAAHTLATLGAWSLVACIINGIEEEVSDGRGYLMLNAAEGLTGGPVSARNAMLIACVLGALFFGLVHYPRGGMELATWTATIGLLYGISYALTGELAMAIGLHTMTNFAQVWLVNLGEVPGEPLPSVLRVRGETSWAGTEDSSMAIVGTVAGIALTLGWVKLTRGSLRLPIERWTSPPARTPAS